jgi:hypothetical protein
MANKSLQIQSLYSLAFIQRFTTWDGIFNKKWRLAALLMIALVFLDPKPRSGSFRAKTLNLKPMF